MKKSLSKYDFRSEAPIGDGGFAKVYYAHDQQENIEVALKVLKPEFEHDHKVVEAFFRDPQIVRKMRHDHIVKIQAVGNNIEKPYFFAMEYCQGGDLKKIMQSGKLPPTRLILQYGSQLCDALTYVHNLGIFHRDIKASNVLFRDSKTAVLTDFGIAIDEVEIKKMLQEGFNVGAPPYMSPEVWLSKEYDAQSDLYSFGVLLYFGLTGSLPFLGKSPNDFKKLHLTSRPVPPSKLRPGITHDIDRLVLALLEKERNHRLSSASELKGYLDKIYQQTFNGEDLSYWKPVIYPENGRGNGIVITDFPYFIGKKEESESGKKNNLVIRSNDPTVSRFHAIIENVNGSFVFTDTSSNGSWVNGIRINHHSVGLESENRIALGQQTRMIIRLERTERRNSEKTEPVKPQQQFHTIPQWLIILLAFIVLLGIILVIVLISPDSGSHLTHPSP